MNPGHANRLAIALVAAGIVGMAVVLGLWQGLDGACSGEDFDPSAPLTTCQPPDAVEVSPVSADPVRADLHER